MEGKIIYYCQNTLENSLGSHHVGAHCHLSINPAQPVFPPTVEEITVSPVRLRRSRGLCLGVTLCDSHRDPEQPGAHPQGHVGPGERSWLGAGTLQKQGCRESPCPTISRLGWGWAHVFSQVDLSHIELS